MFELWFGPRITSLAIPTFTVGALMGFVLLRARPLIDGTIHANT
jgi:hypothetical protein